MRPQSHSTLRNLMACSPSSSSVHGISKARILEGAAISFSRGYSQCRDRTCVSYVSCVAGRFFTTEPPGRPTKEETAHSKGAELRVQKQAHTFSGNRFFFYNGAKVTWCRKNNLLTNGTGAIKTAICK